MGMDVFGRDPKNKTGEYFRANVWWWHPLWEWTCDVCQLPEEIRTSGHHNDGAGPETQELVDLMVFHMEGAIKEGSAKALEEKYELLKKSEEIDPSEECIRCKGSKLDPDGGECRTCKGKGKTAAFASWYSFTEEFALEWIEFVRNSGGFEVW